MCARFETFDNWNEQRRRIVIKRKSKKQSNADRKVNRLGIVPDPISARKFPEKLV